MAFSIFMSRFGLEGLKCYICFRTEPGARLQRYH